MGAFQRVAAFISQGPSAVDTIGVEFAEAEARSTSRASSARGSDAKPLTSEGKPDREDSALPDDGRVLDVSEDAAQPEGQGKEAITLSDGDIHVSDLKSLVCMCVRTYTLACDGAALRLSPLAHALGLAYQHLPGGTQSTRAHIHTHCLGHQNPLQVASGSLVACLGPTSSGKTTLLLSLLGETQSTRLPDLVQVCCLLRSTVGPIVIPSPPQLRAPVVSRPCVAMTSSPLRRMFYGLFLLRLLNLCVRLSKSPHAADTQTRVEGAVSYCDQGTWILQDTVRANIVFGEEFDEKRFPFSLRIPQILHYDCIPSISLVFTSFCFKQEGKHVT